jgi:hypothetical protein
VHGGSAPSGGDVAALVLEGEGSRHPGDFVLWPLVP